MDFFKKIREMDEGSRRVVAVAAILVLGTISLIIFMMQVSSTLKTPGERAAEEPVATDEFSFTTTAKGLLARGYRSVAGILRNLFNISTSKTYDIAP